MKKFILALLLCSMFGMQADAKVNYVKLYGNLQVEGNRITDQYGETVQLKGMSLFWSQWMGQYYNPSLVQFMKKNWGCNVIRAAMGVELGGYQTNPDRELARVETVIKAAIRSGIYVVVDYHTHEGHEDVELAKQFFSYIAEKYGKYDNVIYEPYNEPTDAPDWSTVIKPYNEAVIAAIRAHDPDNLIVAGTRVWSQRVDEAADDPIDDVNVAYTIHFYAASHKQSLRDHCQYALDKGIALFCTEYGTTHYSGNGKLDFEESQIWWDFMEENGISWCNWSIADKNESASAVMPKAEGIGYWTEDQITASGKAVRAQIRDNKDIYKKKKKEYKGKKPVR